MNKLNISGESNEQMLGTGRIDTLFIRYSVPGVVAMLFLALQSIMDGFIVGRLIGADALAAVNIATPSYTLMTAVALIIGIGTQAQMNIHMGRGDYGSVKTAFRSGLSVIVSYGIFFTVAINIFAGPLAGFLGAGEGLLDLSTGYIHGIMPWLAGLACFFYFDYALKALGHPRFAMIVMVGTILANIGLSLFFVGVCKMNTFGVGLGTGLSFTFGMIVSGITVFRQMKRNPELHIAGSRFSWKMVRKILYNGSSEGLAEIAMGITLFLFNITLMRYAGKEGVAAFTIVNYILFIGASFALGVANGVLPILSYNYGANRYDRVFDTVRLGVTANFLLGILFLLILWTVGEPLIRLFLPSSETQVAALAVRGARIVALGFLVEGFSIFAAGFFTAIDKAGLSLVVASLRGLILLSAGVVLLPLFWGVDGIWWTLPITEAVTFAVALWLIYRARQKMQDGAVPALSSSL